MFHLRTRLLFIVFLGKIQYIYGHFERYRKTEAGNRKKGRTYHEISRRFRSAILFVHENIREQISPSTLKRLWGYVSSSHMPRYSSLSTLARYIGYPDWMLCQSSPTITESYFFTSETIHSANLQPGKRLKIAWNPDRQCTIEYQGNSTFSVIESFNTQINKGDSFQVEHFYLHQPLILTNLCRRITPTSFSEPINYAIGYQTGLTSIQLLE